MDTKVGAADEKSEAGNMTIGISDVKNEISDIKSGAEILENGRVDGTFGATDEKNGTANVATDVKENLGTDLVTKKLEKNEGSDDTEDEKNEGSDDTEDENEGVPTDSGFAWIIILNAFLITTVIVGFNRSLSILFMDISQKYEEKATVVSIMFTINSLASSISSVVVSNIIMSRFSVRSICVVAAIGTSLASIALSVAPNIIVFLMIFTFKGAFFGALVVAPISLIGFYFKKRRSLASSLTTSGLCASFVLYPPIANALRNSYGLQGTFLVLAAIELNLVASSMLLRPVESYKTIYRNKKRKKLLKDVRHQSSSANDVSRVQTTSVSYDLVPQNVDDEDDEVENNKLMIEDNTAKEIHSENDGVDEMVSVLDDGSNRAMNDNYIPADHKQSISGSPALCSLLEDEEVHQWQSKEDIAKNKRVKSIKLERQTSHLSAMSLTELPYIVADDDKETIKVEPPKRARAFLLRLLHVILDVSLFKIWRFRMMTLYIPFSVFTNYTIVYMPLIATYIGISKSDAALLMTLGGVMDFVTRIATGFLADFKFVSKPKLVAGSLLVVGTVCHCIRFFNTYAHFVAYAVLIGVFGGVRQNFFNIMLMDFVGIGKAPKAYGLGATIATLTLSINHPVVAALFDATKNFVAPLHYVGAMVYMAVIVLMLEPVFLRLDRGNPALEDKK